VTVTSGTTISLLTPPGRGAVAVVAVEGTEAIGFVERFFRPAGAKPLRERHLGEIIYGRWGATAQEGVIVVCRNERQVEVHCHGGNMAVRRIVDDLTALGAAEEFWRDWTARNEPNVIRRAARVALAGALTERAAMILLDQYHGELEAALLQIAKSITNSETAVATDSLEQLLNRAPLGMHLIQAWRVVIAGPPNVGKSSLANALLGYERAIVFDQPGTTRDVVTAATALDGWPVELSDTAGLSAGLDALDLAGIERATTQADAANCLLLVFDASVPWTDEQEALVERWPVAIVVHNKCDLTTAPHERAGQYTSAKTGQGIETLGQVIASRLVPSPPKPGQPVPFTREQAEALQVAAIDLQAGHFDAAKSKLLAMLA
jgi:tRNA modification GTPase